MAEGIHVRETMVLVAGAVEEIPSGMSGERSGRGGGRAGGGCGLVVVASSWWVAVGGSRQGTPASFPGESKASDFLTLAEVPTAIEGPEIAQELSYC